MKTYKGFNSKMRCRDFQYEEGKEYKTKSAVLCETGFHSCKEPLDCFDYYPPGVSLYHEVEPGGVIDLSHMDSKIASTEIKIGRRLSISEIIRQAVQLVCDRTEFEPHTASSQAPRAAVCRAQNKDVVSALGMYSIAESHGANSVSASSNYNSAAVAQDVRSVAATTSAFGASVAEANHSTAVSTGISSGAATKGRYSVAVSTSDSGAATSEGYRSSAVSTGEIGLATVSGISSAAVSTQILSKAIDEGYEGIAACTGVQGIAENSGLGGIAACTGKNALASVSSRSSVSVASGLSASAEATSNDALAVSFGRNGKARGVKGSYIVLADWQLIDDDWNLSRVRTIHIDGKRYKENVWYTMIEGKVVRVDESEED